jgi:hypothetical protein
LKLSVVDIGYTGAIGMPRCDPNIKLALAQMLNDASSEETGPAENSDQCFSSPSAGASWYKVEPK